MTNQTIPKRSEVPEEMTWNLKDMFASDEAWMTEYEAMKAFPAKIAAFQGTLARSAGDLLAWFRLQDEIELRLSVLMGYASCKGDEDTGNSFYQDVRGKAMNVYVSIASAAAFATPEIMAIPEETLNGFYAQEPELETYRRSLYQIRRRKDHILSPAEERLLASAGEMANASENIAGVFRNADQIFPDVTDSQGSVHPLTDATFVPLLTSPDRELRRRAFETYYKQLGQYKNTIAATLDGQFKQLCFFANARHYDSTIQASLDATEVPVPVYMNLIEAVHNNLDKMYRYVALRKKLLGVDELHMYDVYTPIVADADQAIPYEQAKETVLEALQVLGEDYVALLKEGFSNRWIDVYENVGKRSGAYSSGNSRPHPYVLLNHKDNLDCQFTLAHEMGHALHSYHSCKYQPVSTSDYVIFVAEVASTCNEVLLMRHLLKRPPIRSSGPISSTTSWTSSRAPCIARPCSLSSSWPWAGWPKAARLSPPTPCARSTTSSTSCTSARIWCPTTRSPWNGPGSPISSIITMCSSMPPASPLPWPLPTASSRKALPPWQTTRSSCPAAAAPTPSAC